MASPSVVTPALGYAFTLGLVGVANPCGFPLLPAYAGLFADSSEGRRVGPVRALGASAFVTLGFCACFSVLGLVLGEVVSSIDAVVPWAMIALGAAMALMGILALAGRPLTLPAFRSGARGRGPAAMFTFGVVYAVASLGCALPVFLAAVGGTLTHPRVVTMVGCSLAYALGMGLLFAVLALLASGGRRALVRVLRPAGRFGQVIAALLLISSGAYLSFYWTTDLAEPARVPGLVRAVENFQASLSSWMSDHSRVLGVAFGLVVAAVLVAAAAHGSDWLPARRRAASLPGPVSEQSR